jgi:hypothetical protein
MLNLRLHRLRMQRDKGKGIWENLILKHVVHNGAQRLPDVSMFTLVHNKGKQAKYTACLILFMHMLLFQYKVSVV